MLPDTGAKREALSRSLVQVASLERRLAEAQDRKAGIPSGRAPTAIIAARLMANAYWHAGSALDDAIAPEHRGEGIVARLIGAGQLLLEARKIRRGQSITEDVLKGSGVDVGDFHNAINLLDGLCSGALIVLGSAGRVFGVEGAPLLCAAQGSAFESDSAAEITLGRMQQAMVSTLMSSPSSLDGFEGDRGGRSQSQGESASSLEPIVLGGRSEGPVVFGMEKAVLTGAQFDVLEALCAAGEKGLSKDELVRKSGHEDAVNILKRLTKTDEEWRRALPMPGTPGVGYRIALRQEAPKTIPTNPH